MLRVSGHVHRLITRPTTDVTAVTCTYLVATIRVPISPSERGAPLYRNYSPWCGWSNRTDNILCIWCKPWANAIRNCFAESEVSYYEGTKWTMSMDTMEFQKDDILFYFLITFIVVPHKPMFHKIRNYKAVFHYDYKQNLALIPRSLISCQRDK